MPFRSRKALTVTSCDFDRSAERSGLFRDRGAAEEDHTRQQARQHQADDGQP